MTTQIQRRLVGDVFDAPNHPLAKSVIRILAGEDWVPKPAPHYKINGDVLTRVLIWASAGNLPEGLFGAQMKRSIYAYGPSGAGKTMLFKQFCALTKRPLIRHKCESETTRSMLIGCYKLATPPAPEGSDPSVYRAPEMRWVDGPILTWARTPNAVLLLDEIDRLEADVFAGIQDILDENDILVPETGEKVSISKGCLVAATGNTNGRGQTGGKGGSATVYRGARTQNIATLDRFFTLYLTYMSEEEEVDHLVKTTKIPLAIAKAMAQLATIIRNSFIGMDESAGVETSMTLDFTLTTRNLENWAMTYMLMKGQGLKSHDALNESMRMTFLDFSSQADQSAIIEILKDKIIGGVTQP